MLLTLVVCVALLAKRRRQPRTWWVPASPGALTLFRVAMSLLAILQAFRAVGQAAPEHKQQILGGMLPKRHC